MPAPIDWEDLMSGYNRFKKTNYKSVKEFILNESEKLGIQEFSNQLGVSSISIDRIKLKLGISKPREIHSGMAHLVRTLAKFGQTKNLTAKEISEKVGFKCHTSIYGILGREKIPFKRLIFY